MDAVNRIKLGETKIVKMKKLINSPENLTPELSEGFVEAHKKPVTLGENRTVISNKLTEASGVTIVTRDRSSHEPAISGFVGGEMVDISTVGNVFATPGPQAYLDAIESVGRGKGILYIVLDRTGNMLIGNLIIKGYAKEGLNVVKVVAQEDIANAPRPSADDKRDLVGCILVYRIVGVAAVEGKNLEEMAVIAQWFVDNMVTLTVAVLRAIHPATGNLLADLGGDEMEIGIGQYGEGGDGRQTAKSVDETAKIMLDGLLADPDIREGEKTVLILNGTGAATLMKLLIIYRRCISYLKEKNIEIVSNYAGELLTVQEQTGFQTFMARTDGELLHYWNVSCNTSYTKR